MNIYRIIQNAFLSKKEKLGEITSNEIEKPVVSIQKEELFTSLEIVPLVKDGVLDADDSLTIAKYKNNLKILSSRIKKTGVCDQFRLIREDDQFPYDWLWRKNGFETSRELARSNVAYAVRTTKARNNIKEKKNYQESPFGFEIPFGDEEMSEELSKFPPQYGFILEPSHFRSTKHFTMNLPLPYTGSYNHVSSHRNFTVIDTVDAFCESGYGYSADFGDCYLDVTHESLPISKNAIIMIPEEKYQDIIKNDIIREQLEERRVVVYRGNEGVAINMILSQEGVLPAQESSKYMEYDDELHQIMNQSMQDFCQKHQLDYKHNHGNMFGKGGHFTDLFDGENQERKLFEKEFVEFLRKQLPEYAGLINDTFFQCPEKIVRAIGVDKVAGAIQQYNEWALANQEKVRQRYDLERDSIDSNIHTLFVDTLKLIRTYYKEHPEYESSEEFHSAVKMFFQSSTVLEQKEAALKVQSLLNDKTKQY